MISGLDFSKDGRYLALAERRDCKDFISVFVTSSWQLVKVNRATLCDLDLVCVGFDDITDIRF